MVHVMNITTPVLFNRLRMARSGWISSHCRTLCTTCKSPKKALFYSKNPKTVTDWEKDDSQQMVCSEKMAPNESMIWIFLQVTLVVQFLLGSPVIKKSKSLQLKTYISVEYTEYLKINVTGKPSSPVKTSVDVVKTRKLTPGSPRDVIQSCTICQEIVSKKRFFDERRFGLLKNCDHVVCYGCVRKLCKSTGDGTGLFKTHGVALGPVNCPKCNVLSDKVAASSKWIVGAEKVEFFKTFDVNFSSESMIKLMNDDFKYLHEGENDMLGNSLLDLIMV